ncbi:MAG TPA: nitrogenase component 1 [Methanotrichaceae archaeon]|nr:nitrogenase component 1 [Methanotrichaceae archaeon]
MAAEREHAVERENKYPEVMEAPRYSCALGGAISAALGIYGTVPILHSGAGCGQAHLNGQSYGSGENAGGPQGGTSTPCSCLVEEHVIFGGENKLRNLIESSIELMDGELYAVISGCVPALTGDDVDSVVKEFKDKAEIIHVTTAGFIGNSYDGYELFFDAVIDQLLTPMPTIRRRVNIFGVVPYQHLFWKGDLLVLKKTLSRIGIDANIIFREFGGPKNLKEIPAAELNVVLSPWNGHKIAKRLEEKFSTPYLTFPGVPVGPKQTSRLLLELAKRLDISLEETNKVIEEEERIVYRFLEYLGDVHILGFPHPYFAVVADSGTAIGVTQFLANVMGYLPEVVIVTDNPPEEHRAEIASELTEGIESILKPDVIFESDSHLIRLKLKDRSFLALLASSLEKFIAPELGAAVHLSVSFPSFDRLILERSYAGFGGGLTLMEDILSKIVAPL